MFVFLYNPSLCAAAVMSPETLYAVELVACCRLHECVGTVGMWTGCLIGCLIGWLVGWDCYNGIVWFAGRQAVADGLAGWLATTSLVGWLGGWVREGGGVRRREASWKRWLVG